MTWVDRKAKSIFLGLAGTIKSGSIEIVCPDRTYAFAGGQPGAAAMMVIHDERMFRRALLNGDRGLGESYMDGEWSSPDLVSLLRLALRNSHAFNRLGALSWINRQRQRLSHLTRANTKSGSRHNIAAHYDLGNAFFECFLDRSMLYSSAVFEHADDSLERAQSVKLDRLCRLLNLGPDDHLLEIGTGWGALAIHAARAYGCRVTTTTISREQHDHAADRIRAEDDLAGRITLLFEDYRDLTGQFSKIVSVEMFEAVGLAHYDDFFATCDRLLAPGGAVLLQTITISEQDFLHRYGRTEDWMQGYIFPGSELACLSEVLASLGRVTDLRPFRLEDIGVHYALTIAAWRRRFHASRDRIQRLGFDERFIRMWDLYLAFCQAAFAERHISDVQLLLTRAYHDGSYVGDPGQDDGTKQGEHVRRVRPVFGPT